MRLDGAVELAFTEIKTTHQSGDSAIEGINTYECALDRGHLRQGPTAVGSMIQVYDVTALEDIRGGFGCRPYGIDAEIAPRPLQAIPINRYQAGAVHIKLRALTFDLYRQCRIQAAHVIAIRHLLRPA